VEFEKSLEKEVLIHWKGGLRRMRVHKSHFSNGER